MRRVRIRLTRAQATKTGCVGEEDMGKESMGKGTGDKGRERNEDSEGGWGYFGEAFAVEAAVKWAAASKTARSLNSSPKKEYFYLNMAVP